MGHRVRRSAIVVAAGMAVTVAAWTVAGTADDPARGESNAAAISDDAAGAGAAQADEDLGTAKHAMLEGREPCSGSAAMARGRVVGRVVDEGGKPVAGACLSIAEGLRGDPPDMRAAPFGVTRADGTFSLAPPLLASAFRVLAWAPGLGAGATDAAHPGEALVLRIRRGATITGTATGPDSEPLSGAAVRWLGASRLGVVVVSGRTDARGTYRLTGVPVDLELANYGDSGRLECVADGYAPLRVPVFHANRAGGESHQDLELCRGWTLRVRVLDAVSEEPFAGAEVKVAWPRRPDPGNKFGPWDPFTTAVAIAKTASNGMARIVGLPPLPCNWALVSASAPEHLGSEEFANEQPDGGVGLLTLTVVSEELVSSAGPPPPSEGEGKRPPVKGHVVLPDGRPAIGARVWFGIDLDLSDEKGERIPCAYSDESGAFVLPRPDSTIDDLMARLPGFATARIDGRDISIDHEPLLRLGAGRSLRGRVLAADGTAGANLRLEISDATVRYCCSPAPLLAWGVTEADGTFRFAALPTTDLFVWLGQEAWAIVPVGQDETVIHLQEEKAAQTSASEPCPNVEGAAGEEDEEEAHASVTGLIDAPRGADVEGIRIVLELPEGEVIPYHRVRDGMRVTFREAMEGTLLTRGSSDAEDLVLVSPERLEIPRTGKVEVDWKFAPAARLTVLVNAASQACKDPDSGEDGWRVPAIRVRLLDAAGRVWADESEDSGEGLMSPRETRVSACVPVGEIRVIVEADSRPAIERRVTVGGGAPTRLALDVP